MKKYLSKFIKKHKIKTKNVFFNVGSYIGLVSKQLIQADIKIKKILGRKNLIFKPDTQGMNEDVFLGLKEK